MYLLSSKLAILMWSIPASMWALASTLTSPERGAWDVPQRTTWPFPWPSLPTPHRTPPEWEKLEGEGGIDWVSIWKLYLTLRFGIYKPKSVKPYRDKLANRTEYEPTILREWPQSFQFGFKYITRWHCKNVYMYSTWGCVDLSCESWTGPDTWLTPPPTVGPGGGDHSDQTPVGIQSDWGLCRTPGERGNGNMHLHNKQHNNYMYMYM